jgi:hypothetical protein
MVLVLAALAALVSCRSAPKIPTGRVEPGEDLASPTADASEIDPPGKLKGVQPGLSMRGRLPEFRAAEHEAVGGEAAGGEAAAEETAEEAAPVAPPRDSEAHGLVPLVPEAAPEEAVDEGNESDGLVPRAETARPGLITVPGGIATATEEELIAELRARIAREWKILSQEFYGSAELEDEYRSLRHQAARRLVALSFLEGESEAAAADSAESTLEALEAALHTLGASTSPPALRLLAAAHAARSGQGDDATGATAGAAPLAVAPSAETGAAETGAAETGAADGGGAGEGEGSEEAAAPVAFAIARLTFARSIKGPGSYTSLPREEVRPGKRFLVYGEFENFRTVKETALEKSSAAAKGAGKKEARKAPPGARLRCAFRASLELIDPAGMVVDRLEFLPEGQGEQRVTSARETVNFWARYEVPGDLAPGTYHLRITATDVMSGETATSSIDFRV